MRQEKQIRPRDDTVPWKLGGLRAKQLAVRVWGQMNEDDVFGRAAELSYYFFLAVFPMLFFLVSLLGLIAHGNPELQERLMSFVAAVMPADAASLISKTLREIIQASSNTKLIVGLLAALWTAAGGMKAVMDMLNVTYDVKDDRPYWKSRGIAVLLTIAVSVLGIAALGLILYGPKLANAVFGDEPVIAWAWKIAQWPVVVFFGLLSFALTYYFGPDVEHAKWRWISPGSVAGLVLWLIISFAFRVYLHFFNSYSATYGSLGAVIILLVWFYLTGAAVMTGSEINAEIEHAAAERGEPQAKPERGKKPQAA